MAQELVIFGVPHGWSISDCDEQTNRYLELFYGALKSGIEFKPVRLGNKMFYTLLVQKNPDSVFQDVNGRGGSFFGMSLIYDNQYVTDPTKVRQLLQATYDHYVKGQIIEELPNGIRKYKIRSLSGNNDRVADYVGNGMMRLLDNSPEFRKALSAATKPLPPLQNQLQRDY